MLQGAFELQPAQPVENGRFQQADTAQSFLVVVFNKAPNAERKGLGQRDTIDPWSRVEEVSHLRRFHSEAGIGSEDTASFWRRWVPAPRNERGCVAGTIRT